MTKKMIKNLYIQYKYMYNKILFKIQKNKMQLLYLHNSVI